MLVDEVEEEDQAQQHQQHPYQLRPRHQEWKNDALLLSSNLSHGSLVVVCTTRSTS